MTPDLRYPIGPFVRPDTSTITDRASRIDTLAQAPAALRAVVLKKEPGSVNVANINGALALVLVVAHDITARRQTERALREREELHRRLFAAESDAIFLVDPGNVITDANQASNTPDMEVRFSRPLQPVPAVGLTIAVVGTLSDYRLQPFSFVMTGAELAPESLPVAGGPCADPRPQMCTRDYRPACGLRRDNTSRTYGNACSACADSEVVSQSARACPNP